MQKPWGFGFLGGRIQYATDYEEFLKSAYDNPFFFSCINEIVTDFNTAKIGVFTMKNGKRIKVEDSDVDNWLKKPNIELTQSKFQEYYITWLLLGGGLLLKKSKGVLTKNLYIYAPNTFEISRDQSTLQINSISIGDKVYSGNELKDYKIVKATNIRDSIAGYSENFRSVVKSAAVPGDITNFAFNHQASQLANSGKRTGILEYKKFLSEKAKKEAKDNFESMGSGGGNAGRIAMLNGENFKFTPMDLNMQELDWLNSIKLMREIICGVLGVPVQLLSSDASTYNNRKEVKKAIYADTISPLLRSYCEEMTSFLADDLAEGQFISYDLSEVKVLQEDASDNIKKLTEALDGVATVNEIRNIISETQGIMLKPSKEEGADMIWKNSSEMPMSQASSYEDPAEGNGDE